MVAQSYEVVVTPTQPWGRTSPRAASTAAEQQPMDLVKRKHGQIQSEACAYELGLPSSTEDQACQPESLRCESVFISSKTEQQQLSSKKAEPSTESFGCRSVLIPSKTEQQQLSNKAPEPSALQATFKPRKREMLSRWQRENSQDVLIPRAKRLQTISNEVQNLQLQSFVESRQDEINGNPNLNQMKEAVPQSQKNCSSKEAKEDEDPDQLIITNFVCTLLRPVDRNNPSGEKKNLEIEESHGKQGTFTEEQNSLPIQNPVESNEEETVVDISKNQFFENSLESEENTKLEETLSEGTVQQSYTELQSKFESGKDTELNPYDYDKDEVLVIAESDCQVVELDCEPESVEVIDECLFENPQDQGKYEDNQDFNPKNRSRSESQRKMKEGRRWLLNNLLVVASTTSVIKLSAIEESYISYCKENDKEPLATPVLARLIHSTFPDASKCRLGARGSQRIHYRRLRFKSDVAPSNQRDQTMNSHTQSFVQNEFEEPQSKMNPGSKVQLNQLKTKDVRNGQIKQNSNIDAEKKNVLFKISQFRQQNQSDLAQNDEENCKRAAKKVKEVLQWITRQGENHRLALLRDFAHSASCQKPKCEHVCLMFRRVRRHVVAAKHSCHVLRLYSMLLRHHVSMCNEDNCGLPACPALRSTCSNRKGEEGLRQSAKRPSTLQTLNSARLPRSPGGSLPGSPVNSPPLSPVSFVDMSSLAMAQTPQSSIGSLTGSPLNSPCMSPSSLDGMTPMTGQGAPVQYVVVQVPMVMRLVDTQGA